MIIKQSKEEVANSITHFFGVCIAIIASILLLLKVQNGDINSILGVAIFSIGMISLYTSSTFYHWTLPGKLKRVLRYCDHINIYVLISASYSPILIGSIGGTLGWTIFFIMWAMTLIGAFYKIFFLGKYPKLSLAIYLIMGWSVIIIAKSLWDNLPTIAILFMLSEAFFYTVGTYFYSHDNMHKYYHAIWHLFVLGGTVSHILAVWFSI